MVSDFVGTGRRGTVDRPLPPPVVGAVGVVDAAGAVNEAEGGAEAEGVLPAHPLASAASAASIPIVTTDLIHSR
jgi:hypothetical protein